MKTILAIAVLTISFSALADPVVSQSALNYAADQSVPPIATKPKPITSNKLQITHSKTTDKTPIKLHKRHTKKHIRHHIKAP